MDTAAEIEETKALLSEARLLGLKVKDVANIIDVKPATVSGYGKPRKGGRSAQPMPPYNRIKLRTFLDNRGKPPGQRRATDLPEALYPSQRIARAHELIEELGRGTQADDPIWTMVLRTIETALEMRGTDGRIPTS